MKRLRHLPVFVAFFLSILGGMVALTGKFDAAAAGSAAFAALVVTLLLRRAEPGTW